MPGPIVKFNKPDVANLASQLPEPLQKPAAWVGQFLSDLVGADDPQSSIPGPAAPMVSIYKDAMGIPSKTLREKGTQEFLQSMVDHINHAVNGARYELAVGQAAHSFAERYPRIAAHMRLEKENPSGEGFVYSPTGMAAAYARTPAAQVKRPINIGITDLGAKAIDQDPMNAQDFIFHEGTHVAQAIGNKDFSDLYNAAHKLVGNKYNPFEDGAIHAASRHVESLRGKNRRDWGGFSANRYLQGVVDDSNENLWKRVLDGTIETIPDPPPGAVRKGIGWWVPNPNRDELQREADFIKNMLQMRGVK